MLTIRRKQRSAFGSAPAQAVADAPVATAEASQGTSGVRIRPEQMKTFEQVARIPFEDEMAAHSKAFAPRLCDVLGDEQLRVALRQAMARAGGYGFTYRGPIRLFIEMTFLFGSAFDTDPQYPWAQRILRSQDDQMCRAEQLFDKILDYQEKVSGPAGSNTLRALREVLATAQKPLALGAGDFAVGMRTEMARVFPEKAAYIGNEGLTALIREGRAEACKRRFPSPRGETVLATLMFAFGHGCTADPLYPWIARTLTDERIMDPPARAERLEKRAVTWLEHVLGTPQEGGLT